jgi:hypothetical protein
MINKFMTKLSDWFNPSDSMDMDLKRPRPFYERFKALSGQIKGRGDKREPNKRIDEFHLRGAAGRREVRGPIGVSKAVMPSPGRRVTSQKKK